MILYKAVAEDEGEFYSLGMGPALIVHLPRGEWIDGGFHGFAASPTPGAARTIIRIANMRKRLPIPPNMQVIKIEADMRCRISKARFTCNTIHILDERNKEEAE